jgi:hypothetical protein
MKSRCEKSSVRVRFFQLYYLCISPRAATEAHYAGLDVEYYQDA